ncbi:hypothetical protein FI667_g12036, partial [Globisporangium splendens]
MGARCAATAEKEPTATSQNMSADSSQEDMAYSAEYEHGMALSTVRARRFLLNARANLLVIAVEEESEQSQDFSLNFTGVEESATDGDKEDEQENEKDEVCASQEEQGYEGEYENDAEQTADYETQQDDSQFLVVESAAQRVEYAEQRDEEEDRGHATNYVGNCHEHLEHLRKRKREQEEQVENLVEATFTQIDALVNGLMSAIQEHYAASHNQFEITETKLTNNLQFHNRVEKKLKMIASIFPESAMQAARVTREEMAVANGNGMMETAAATPPLLVSAPPVRKTKNKQLQAVLTTRFHQFNQWRIQQNETRFMTLTLLRHTLDDLLPMTSLEILRRHPEHRDDLLLFYQATIEEDRLDKRLLLKELWMFYIIQGDFYEAYHLYKDEIQSLDVHEDPRLMANFGILCYWLLFIESSEIRDKLKREEDLEVDESEEEGNRSENEDEDDAFANSRSKFNQWSQPSQSIESLIENRYLFKTSIGVHILYQEAASSLRRAASLCPNSAQFVEFYVQLLVLVGDIQNGCDYLENFYHLNPTDPHAARMMMDIASAGSISSLDLVSVLVEAVDVCGGDLYLLQNPSLSLVLWKHLAQLAYSIESAEDVSLQDAADGEQLSPVQKLRDIGISRSWWKRIYLARPSTLNEVAEIAQGHEEVMEVTIYRAVVARGLFGPDMPMVASLHAAMDIQAKMIRNEHVHLFRSFFPKNVEKFSSSRESTKIKEAPIRLRDIPFTHICQENEPNSSAFPVFSGEQALATGRVLHRSDVLARDTLHANQARVKVTTDSIENQVDQELIAALEEAVREDLFEFGVDSQQRELKRKYADLARERSTTSKEMAAPIYLDIVEEAGYKDREASTDHIYSYVARALRHMNTDAIVPTKLEVRNAHNLFMLRWARNEHTYGNPGLLLRYEVFITKYVRDRMKAAQGSSTFQISAAMVDDVMQQMKKQVAGSHVHYPARSEVEKVMRVKVGSLRRLRRKLLQEYRRAMKEVLLKLVFVETDDLAQMAFRVCDMNGYEDIVSLEDFQHIAVLAQVSAFREVVSKIETPIRDFLSDKEMRGPSNDLELIMACVNKKYPDHKMSFHRLKAFLWLEEYRAVHGSIEDDSDDDVVESDPDDSEQ